MPLTRSSRVFSTRLITGSVTKTKRTCMWERCVKSLPKRGKRTSTTITPNLSVSGSRTHRHLFSYVTRWGCTLDLSIVRALSHYTDDYMQFSCSCRLPMLFLGYRQVCCYFHGVLQFRFRQNEGACISCLCNTSLRRLKLLTIN